MLEGKLVFAQLMDHLPLRTLRTLRRCSARFDGDRALVTPVWALCARFARGSGRSRQSRR